MLIRRRHKLMAVYRRRCTPDDFEPAVMVGPVLIRYTGPRAAWLQGDLMPRFRINGRWLPARWASHVRWSTTIGHRGSRRGDRRANMKRKAAERCSLYRYTSMPF